MKRAEEHTETERGSGKTARFASVVEAAGKPEVYLPLFDPKQDRNFMRAVKENRVLSVRQEPTSTRADFGAVGFDEKQFTTLLVFPRPLTTFLNARVVGIKYDLVRESRVVASKAPRPPKFPKARPEKHSPASSPATRSTLTAKRSKPKPEPPKRAAPPPKEFRVRVRVTTVTEKDVTVKALTKTEAKKTAQGVVESEGSARAVSVQEI